MPISGCVYLIHPNVANGNTKIYVGSTTEFVNRKSRHKRNSEREDSGHYNCPVYQYIRQYGGWDAFKMSVIEEREYEDDDELRFCEQYHLNRVPIEMRLNTNSAYKTESEIREHTRKYKALYFQKQKQQRENNPELKEAYLIKTREIAKKWYADNPERGLSIQKKYKETHKEAVYKRRCEYRAKNRDAINKRRREIRAKKRAEALT